MGLNINFNVLGFNKLQKVTAELNKINSAFEKNETKLKNNKKLLEGLGDNKILRFFDSLNNKIINVDRESRQLNAVGGTMGLFTSQLGQSWQLLGLIGGKSILGKLSALARMFRTLAVPWVIITAAVYTAFSVWKENIGGIQSKWNNFTSSLRRRWSEFDRDFRTKLRQYEPFFNRVFTQGFALLSGIFDGLLTSITFISDLLGPMFKMFSDWFGLTNTEGAENISKLQQIGKWIAIITVGIAALALVSNPFGWAVLALAGLGYIYNKFAIIRTIVKGLGTLMYNSFVQPFIDAYNVLKKMWDIGSKVVGFFTGNNRVDGSGDSAKTTQMQSFESAVANTSGGSTNNDNRQANVVINTQSMNPLQANAIGNSFINPVMSANKFGS